MNASVITENAIAVFTLMFALWLVSVWRRDASIVDPWWSMGFLLISVRTWLAAGAPREHLILLSLVAVWALRLWLHLLLRARGKPEDPRYQAFRQRFGQERYWWISLFHVFLLQGVLLIAISMPLQCIFSAPPTLNFCTWLGAAIVLVGTVLEATADWQLQRFRDDPTRRGKVLDTGLWRYSRHPNYFAEALLWWGFGIAALSAPWAPWTLAAPAFMTFLLLRVSGVTMLERQLEKTKPAYRDYVARTSAFIPLPPRA